MLRSLRHSRSCLSSLNRLNSLNRLYTSVPETRVSNLVKTRQKKMAPTYGLFQTFKQPVALEHASMQYYYDFEGKTYLDCLASNLTISIGHAHPKVQQAVNSQGSFMPHVSSMYYSEPVAQLTEKLLSKFPKRTDGEAWKVYYAVTGTEAVEVALQLSRVYTGQDHVVGLRNSYHGSYGIAMAASGTEACRHDLNETKPFTHLEAPLYEKAQPAAVQELLDHQVEHVRREGTSFLYEVVQGYGGIHILPKEYLQTLERETQFAGGVSIADEIQNGLGRMGTHYWAYQMHDLNPDIVIVAKGLGNGYPISAVVAREGIWDRFMDTGKFLFTTYGAQPVACMAACAVLDTIDEQNIMAHANNVGQYYHNAMTILKHKHPEVVTDLRGSGLMHGIEIRKDLGAHVFEEMRNRYILPGLGGADKNVLRFMPPMCIEHHNIDKFVTTLDDVLDATR